MVALQQIRDFVILGPAMAPGNRVMEAIHALYFLPENFKLILTDSKTTDQSFYEQVLSLVEHDELSGRVRFSDDRPAADITIVASPVDLSTIADVTGESPEALASAILVAARAV